MTLASGESHYLMTVSVGESDALVAFDVYPDDMRGLDDLLAVETLHEGGRREVDHVTRTMIVAPPHNVLMVEILDELPGRAGLGFQAPPDEQAPAAQ